MRVRCAAVSLGSASAPQASIQTTPTLPCPLLPQSMGCGARQTTRPWLGRTGDVIQHAGALGFRLSAMYYSWRIL